MNAQRNTSMPNSASILQQHTPARLSNHDSVHTAALSVLAVTPQGGTSGARATHLLELGRGLLSQGDRFRTITTTSTPHNAPTATSLAARHIAHPRLAATTSAVVRALLDEPADIVQCSSIRDTYAAALAIFAASMRYPRRREPILITTLPFLSHATHDGFYRRAARHLRLLSDGVIVASSAARTALLMHRFPPNHIAVVPPIHDLRACFRVGERAMPSAVIPGVPPKARIVLTISRPAPRSGLTYLLDAWPLVARAVPDAYLVVASSAGTASNDLSAHAPADELPAASSSADRTVFTGTRIPIPSLLARADVFALSETGAGAPTALFQALAARRPAVAAATGGIPDVIAHEQTGLLVPPCDCLTLATAIQTLLNDRALAQRLAAAGHQQARQRYTRHALIAATRAAYLQALDRRAARRAAQMPYDL